MNEAEVESFISHYGKKGMRWGVRKGRTIKEQKVMDKRQKASKKRRTLSDTDLEKYINRIQKEKKFKELADSDLHPGRTKAKEILKNSGTKAATLVLTGAMVYATKAIITREFKTKDLASHIPKPKK